VLLEYKFIILNPYYNFRVLVSWQRL